MLYRLSLMFALLMFPFVAKAEIKPVVLVELYTSQGCSSCPPADALLQQLAERSDVLPLALHVDYWDYIGWKDAFAKPEFTKRQKQYARVMQAKSIFTPQAIINGAVSVVGSNKGAMEAGIASEAPNLAPITLSAAYEGEQWELRFTNSNRALNQRVAVTFVQFKPHADVNIKAGENAGRLLSYAQIVTDLTVIDRRALSGSWINYAKFPKRGNYAVFLQAEDTGRVLSSYRIK